MHLCLERNKNKCLKESDTKCRAFCKIMDIRSYTFMRSTKQVKAGIQTEIKNLVAKYKPIIFSEFINSFKFLWRISTAKTN